LISQTDPDSLERFRDAIVRRLGLLFDESKAGFLGEVLQRRSEGAGMPIEAYLALLEANPGKAEIGRLAEALTVGETYFFRNVDQFHAFTEVALPERMRANAVSRRLRVLSAGCASGEEAYTLAIILRTAIDPSWQVTIRAIDANPAALRKAAAARYSSWSLRDTPADIQQRWFRNGGRDAILDETIRTAVTFEERNLAVDDADLWQGGSYDVIFCRNVLMYFTPDIMRQAMARISHALAPGGYLFLGHAETMRGLSNDFHLRHSHNTFYYQRRDRGDEGAPIDVDISSLPVSSMPAVAAPMLSDVSWYGEIGRASDRVVALTSRTAAAVALKPEPVAPTWNLAVALDLLQRERFTEALGQIDAMPQAAVNDPDVLLLRAVLLSHSGQARLAAETALRLLALDEMNAGANYILAVSFEHGGERNTAANHYRVAIYLDPTFAMPRLHLGILLRRSGEYGEARRELKEALLLFQREDPSRLLLFGSGFTRDALIALCQSEIERCVAKQ
jgi:chemotaxis protein methyltransferase CheR